MQRKVNHLFLLIPFVFILLSCSKEFNNTKDMSAYLKNPDNNYCSSVTEDDLNMTLIYQPTDLIVHNMLKNQTNVSVQKIDSLRKFYSQYLYFVCSLTYKDKNILHCVDKNMYSELVNVFAFNMNQYTALVSGGKDTLLLKDFYFNQLFEIGQQTEILLVYNKPNNMNRDIEIIFFNLNLWSGKKFKFSSSKLNKQPKLKNSNFTI